MSLRLLINLVYNNKGRFYEIKVDSHLRIFPEEFVPTDFQSAIRPYLDRITLMTEDYSFKDRDIRYFQLGQSEVSYDAYKLMVRGKNLSCMVKALNIFCKRKGEMGDFGKRQTVEQVELERLKRANKKLSSEIQTLNSQLNTTEALFHFAKAAGESLLREGDELRATIASIETEVSKPWWKIW
jgi:hypothetical protein